MVTEWIMNAFTAAVAALLGTIHVPDAPSWLLTAGDKIASIGPYLQGTGNWVPWPIVVGVFATWAIMMGAMVVIKGVRIAASFLTLGGGSAA